MAGADQVLTVATAVPPVAALLMGRFWPGPLTLVVPRRPDLAADLGDDEATVGVRCPDHEVPLALCRRRGPLATTSANLHGQPTLTTAAEVEAALGEAVAVVLDGGPCTGDALDGGRLHRRGAQVPAGRSDPVDRDRGGAGLKASLD